jgi:hypothetical protein
MSAYGRIAMFGLAMACRRRACEELALDCKVVLEEIPNNAISHATVSVGGSGLTDSCARPKAAMRGLVTDSARKAL